MIEVLLLIGVTCLSVYVGYTVGYCCGFDDGVLSEVKRQIDKEFEEIKRRNKQ